METIKQKGLEGKWVCLVRHAQAVDPVLGQSDFDRQLTPKGEKQAMVTADFLLERGLLPDLLLFSPSRRTQQTTKAIIEKLQVEALAMEELYNCSRATMEEIIGKYANGKLMIVGHNPAISNVAAGIYNHDLSLRPSEAVCFSLDINSHNEILAHHTID